MAVIFAEQSETGSASWLSVTGGWSASTAVTAGTWSTYALRSSASNQSCVALWATAVGEFYGQARFYVTDFSTASFLQFTSPNGTANVLIGFSAGEQIRVLRGGTLIATGTTVLSQLQWYYLQFHFTIHDTTGTVELKINSVAESLTFVTGTYNTQDTRNDAAAGGDTCDRVHHDFTGNDFYLDDVVINDTSDTDNVTYPANIKISALLASAAGDNTGLTPLAGSNYQNVDERPPDDATTYNSHATVDNYDLYNYPATTFATVAAVVLPLRVQASDAGAKSVAHILKYDSDANDVADTEVTGSDVALSTSWTYATKIYNRFPNASAWSGAKVNSLQAGAKVRP